MIEQIFLMFIIMSGAAIVPFIGRRLHIPSSVIEILYGLLVFNLFIRKQPEWFLLMKELGIIYLMFIAGMELNITRLREEKRIIWYILVPITSLLLTPFIFMYMGYSYYIGISVAIISAGIVIPVLKELNLLDTPIGKAIMGIALTGELISILLLAFIDIYHSAGVSMMALLDVIKLIGLLILTGLFLKILYILAWWNPEKVEKVMESEDPVEEGIRAVVSIAFAGALLAYLSGVEAILGSFLAGVVFSYVFKSKGIFEDKLNAIGFGFFIPFFFIGVGADLDISLILHIRIIYTALFFTIAIFMSNILIFLMAPFMGLKKIEALGINLILSAPLSLLVVTGSLGVRMNLIARESYEILILTGIMSSILYPVLFRMIYPRLISTAGTT